ncbi:DNA cytosine methyltransferase [Bowmanella denitrificans]|uniref:DNA cytosine methyltransferase n=1 Tax=Bowmanella denitrificans TaxID=366582 RepID=UPI000C9ACEB2|nr:DNA cytosine methyltransferase [Bowmanella denitrificans]
MTAYYNEIDPKAASWLRVLIQEGHIAQGVVDERSIEDVTPNDLKGFTQCHFFAGVGVWSYALRRAGWPDDKPVWTGSCPCQPFSTAGKGAGFADERHLWPAWFHLVNQCQPHVVIGEQVASKDGLTWLDLVQTDMENKGYAGGAIDLCAAGVGAPHIRQRLWLAYTKELSFRTHNGESKQGIQQQEPIRGCSIFSGLADMSSAGRHRGPNRQNNYRRVSTKTNGALCGLAVTESSRRKKWTKGAGRQTGNECIGLDKGDFATRQTNGLWADADWLFCKDGKWRPVEPGTFPLVDGDPARVGRLRGYGNAINAEAAAEFISAFMLAMQEQAA